MSDEPTPQASDAPPAEVETEQAPVTGAAEQTPRVDLDAVRAEYESKLARALNSAQQREREKYELEQKYRHSSEKLSELETLQQELRKNPLKALENYGHTYEGLTNEMLNGEHQPLTPDQQELQAAKEELAQLRGTLEEFQGQYKSAAERQEFQADVRTVRQVADAEEFEVLRELAGDSDFESITSSLREAVQSGTKVDVHAHLRELQDGAVGRARKMIQSKATLALALQDPETKAHVLKALQAEGGERSDDNDTAQQATEGDGTRNEPRTITNTLAAEPGTKGRQRTVSDDERRQRAIAVAEGLFKRSRSA